MQEDTVRVPTQCLTFLLKNSRRKAMKNRICRQPEKLFLLEKFEREFLALTAAGQNALGRSTTWNEKQTANGKPLR